MQALLRFNALASFILVLFSCDYNEKNSSACYNADSVVITTKGGISSIGSVPITGIVYSLNNNDVLFIDRYLNGKKDGICRQWYPNKQLKEVRYFESGKYESEHKGWWEDGKQKFIYHYKNDEFDGNVEEWQSDGLLFRDFNFKNGYEDGMQRMWYANGKIKANYFATNGRQYGLTGTKHCVNVLEKNN